MSYEAKVIFAVVAAGLALLAVLLYFGIRSQNAWEASCQAQGGIVRHSSKLSPVITGKSSGVAVSTTYFCLTSDGRVLGIK